MITAQQLTAFETRVKELWEAGELPSLIHLAGGNDEQLVRIFKDIKEEDWIFNSHRAHFHCLLKGMPEEEVLEHIRRDASMFIYSQKYRIYCSAILGGCCGIAAGVARAIKDKGGTEHVWCFLGDGAADNGHLYEAAMYVTGHDLPCTFVIENNDRQVDTDIATRRGPHWKKFHLFASCVREYSYTPTYPHAGSGCKHLIEFKRKTPL